MGMREPKLPQAKNGHSQGSSAVQVVVNENKHWGFIYSLAKWAKWVLCVQISTVYDRKKNLGKLKKTLIYFQASTLSWDLHNILNM